MTLAMVKVGGIAFREMIENLKMKYRLKELDERLAMFSHAEKIAKIPTNIDESVSLILFDKVY